MARKKPPQTETSAAEPNKGGRPPTYIAQFVQVARKLCELGATDRDLAEAFKVAERTIKAWRLEHSEFADACKVGKAPADDRVEASLYRRATGYSFDAVKIVTIDGSPCSVPYVEHVPPDTTACIFWLKNRRPDSWREKIDILATVKPADVTADPLSPDDWDRQHGGARAN